MTILKQYVDIINHKIHISLPHDFNYSRAEIIIRPVKNMNTTSEINTELYRLLQLPPEHRKKILEAESEKAKGFYEDNEWKDIQGEDIIEY